MGARIGDYRFGNWCQDLVNMLLRFLGLSRQVGFTRPRRIILVRHGESEGNLDENTYATTPDWKINLTDRGKTEARDAGKELSKLVEGQTIMTYVSPYARTMQTWHKMKQQIEQQPDITLIGTRQEPRIAEQQFGNFQNPNAVRDAKEERHEYGRFFFRFPNGEAGLDVYTRATSFLATLTRDIKQLRANGVNMKDCNILVVTHGLTLRLILMRYFQLTVDEFEFSENPPNATLIVMDRCKSEEYGWEYYRLDEASRNLLNLKGDVTSEKPVFWRERTDL